MSNYFLSLQAVIDLTEINDFLFAGNQVAADTLLDKISQKFEQLAQFPKMGRKRDELSPSLRSFLFQVATTRNRSRAGDRASPTIRFGRDVDTIARAQDERAVL